MFIDTGLELSQLDEEMMVFFLLFGVEPTTILDKINKRNLLAFMQILHFVQQHVMLFYPLKTLFFLRSLFFFITSIYFSPIRFVTNPLIYIYIVFFVCKFDIISP